MKTRKIQKEGNSGKEKGTRAGYRPIFFFSSRPKGDDVLKNIDEFPSVDSNSVRTSIQMRAHLCILF